MRGHRGHAGGVGLIGKGEGRPWGSRVVLLRDCTVHDRTE